MTFVSTLIPSLCFFWLTFTTGVATYNTLDQDVISVWDLSMQSNAIPFVEDVLFHFCSLFFSLIMRLSKVQRTF